MKMRNFIVTRGEGITTITLPNFFHSSKFAQFLYCFYQDGDSVNMKYFHFSFEERQFLDQLFGEPDHLGFLMIKPLSSHFGTYHGVRRFSDAKLMKQNGLAFPLHRLLLSTRGEYFSTAFEIGFEETLTKTLKLPQVNETTIELLIKFLYYQEENEWLKDEFLIELLYASDFLLIPEITDKCVQKLLQGFQQGIFDTDTVCSILEASQDLNLGKLKQACLKFAIENMNQIQDCDEFLELSSELKAEVKALIDFESNPLGKAKALFCAKEILAILKESLQLQISRLNQVQEQFEMKKLDYDLDIETIPTTDGPLSDEIKNGRRLFLQHWENLIKIQEARVNSLNNYIIRHQRIFESLYQPKISRFN